MSTPQPSTGGQRCLVLMRHAKSDWGSESLSDHQRPLNPRGAKNSPRMADWLAEIDATPDLILSSSAARTRETVDLMTPQWAATPTTSFSDSLYLATPEAILSTVASDGLDARVLMVVAHNPGMAHLVSHFASRAIDMPTAAIAVFDVEISSWSELRSSSRAELIQFMQPKSL